MNASARRSGSRENAAGARRQNNPRRHAIQNERSAVSKRETYSDSPCLDIVDDIVADARDGALTLGDILDDLGDRSYGPLFFLIGLTILLPIGAIPGVPIVLGAVLIILAIQFVFGLKHPWMPDRFRSLSVTAEKACAARNRVRPFLNFVDRFVDTRIVWIVSRPMRVFAAVSIVLLSLAMIPLEFVPFGVAAPAAAVAAFGLAIVARDGLLMMIALGFVGGTGWLLASAWSMIFGSQA
jgi:hypothetical protein